MNYTHSTIGVKIKEKLGLEFFPVGMFYSDTPPENAIGFKRKGNGCIVPLVFSSAKGKTVAFDKDTTGWDCSAFFLGYKDWIFNGIECFLSNGSIIGRKGERFIKTKSQAKAFIKSFVPKSINNSVTIFKPLENFGLNETPEIVIFFANPDQLSGLVNLLHFNSPEKDDLIITRFMSGCGSIVTLPMKYKNEGKLKAVWGMHDISARLRIPAELMTITIPYDLLKDIYKDIDKSFIITDNWKRIKERN
jgi:uncharacterized protein (DUF169 family)